MHILIFAAHPDDAEFGAGGTLLLLKKNCTITICTLTDGSAGNHGSPSIRKKEQESAAKALGAKLLWLGKCDCTVEYTREACFEMAQIIRSEKPDIILAPHHNQKGGLYEGKAHPDHIHLGLIIRDAARFARFNIEQIKGEKHSAKQLWYYMITDQQGALALPIDSVMNELIELWNCYESQHALRDGDIINALLSSRSAAASAMRGVKHAELIACDSALRGDLVCAAFGLKNS